MIKNAAYMRRQKWETDEGQWEINSWLFHCEWKKDAVHSFIAMDAGLNVSSIQTNLKVQEWGDSPGKNGSLCSDYNGVV